MHQEACQNGHSRRGHLALAAAAATSGRVLSGFAGRRLGWFTAGFSPGAVEKSQVSLAHGHGEPERAAAQRAQPPQAPARLTPGPAQAAGAAPGGARCRCRLATARRSTPAPGGVACREVVTAQCRGVPLCPSGARNHRLSAGVWAPQGEGEDRSVYQRTAYWIMASISRASAQRAYTPSSVLLAA